MEAASWWEKHGEQGPGAVTVPSTGGRLTWGAAERVCTCPLAQSSDATCGTVSRLPVVRVGEDRVGGAVTKTARRC